MNVTLSIDEKLVDRAREVARQQGKSLNALIREWLERIAGAGSGPDVADQLLQLMRKHGGRSRGRKSHRQDAYAGRV
jgi:hypothetical protein